MTEQTNATPVDTIRAALYDAETKIASIMKGLTKTIGCRTSELDITVHGYNDNGEVGISIQTTIITEDKPFYLTGEPAHVRNTKGNS